MQSNLNPTGKLTLMKTERLSRPEHNTAGVLSCDLDVLERKNYQCSLATRA
jgi:hypothetical protein